MDKESQIKKIEWFLEGLAFFSKAENTKKTFGGWGREVFLGYVFNLTKQEGVNTGDAVGVREAIDRATHELNTYLRELQYPTGNVPSEIIEEVSEIGNEMQQPEASRSDEIRHAVAKHVKDYVDTQSTIAHQERAKAQTTQKAGRPEKTEVFLATDDEPERVVVDESAKKAVNDAVLEIETQGPNEFQQKFVREASNQFNEAVSQGTISLTDIELAGQLATENLLSIKQYRDDNNGELPNLKSNPEDLHLAFLDSNNPILVEAISDPVTRKNLSLSAAGVVTSFVGDRRLAETITSATSLGPAATYLYGGAETTKYSLVADAEAKNAKTAVAVNLKELVKSYEEFASTRFQLTSSIPPEMLKQLSDKEIDRIVTQAIKESRWRERTSSFVFSPNKSQALYALIQGSNNTYPDGFAFNRSFTISAEGESIQMVQSGFGFIKQATDVFRGTSKVGSLLGIGSKQAAKEAGKLAAKTATKAAASKIAAATAASAVPIPIVSQIISAVMLALSLKDLAVFLKTNFRKIADKLPYILAALFGAGFLLTGAPILIVGGIGALALGGRAYLAGFGSGIIYTLTHFLIPTLLAPIFISFIFLVIATTIILIIINSSAYVYPPGTGVNSGAPPGLIQSEYVNITKTADADRIENISGSKTINYTVKIVAKKDSFTIKNITNNYSVIGGASPQKIVSPADAFSPYIGKAVVSGDTVTISYSINLNETHNNSLVEDIVTVNITTTNQEDSTASTSHVLTVGTPPIDCPIPGGYVSWGSYVPGDESAHRHGTNAYWGSGACTLWALPQSTFCYGPSDPQASANKCFKESTKCPYYGYAIDVSGGNTVMAPRVAGQNVTWDCSYAFPNNGGANGYTYRCSSGEYRLILTHIKNNAKTGLVKSGEKIGELYPMSGAHLHIEFAVNGQYVMPETYFCR